MRFDELLTDDAVLTELGARLARHRLERNLTQAELADRAGIGRATLQRLEDGRSVQATSLVKVLRTLGLIGGLDAVVPERVVMPIAEVDRARKRRERARPARNQSAARGQWVWGDEQDRGD
jgi:transcriptional regulator with XRE-family HTH domain